MSTRIMAASSYTDPATRHDMTIPQREEYIQAVLCLQSLPPKADQKKYPGVKNRYDDFVLTHETQAFHLHSTVSSPHNGFENSWLISCAASSIPGSSAVHLGIRESTSGGVWIQGLATSMTPNLQHLVASDLASSTGTGDALPPTQSTRRSSMETCPAWVAMARRLTTPVYQLWASRSRTT